MADFAPPPLSSWEGPAPAAPPPAAQPSAPTSGGDWWSANAPPAKAAPKEEKKPYRKIPPGTKVLGSPVLPAEGLVFSAVAEGLSKLDQILGMTGDTGDKPSYRKNGPKPHTPILGAPITPKPGVAPETESEAAAPPVKKATAPPPKPTKAVPPPAATAPGPPVVAPAPEPPSVVPAQAEAPTAPEEPIAEQAPSPAETPAAAEPVSQPPADGKALWKKGDAVPAYDQVVNIDPHDLKPDPARFQYKQEAIGKGGTTDEFRDVTEWDHGLGGAMAVWQDPETGVVSPVNGHHRTEMAQRTNPPHVNVRFIDAKTPTEARTFGAMLNIGEGKGTALDAAKLFRDSDVTPADLAKYKISPSSKLAVQGMALSKLEPSIYRMVVDGKMTPTRGALIGDLLGEDPAAQKAAVDFF